MELILKKRGERKTTELIRRSAETHTYILVSDKRRVKNIVKTAKKLNLHIPYPITFMEYLENKLRGSHIKNILIDDADDLLRHIFFNIQIDAITITDTRGDTDDT